jgi:cobalamin biosynthesis protein CbiD
MVLYSSSKDDDFLDEILVDDYVAPPTPSQPQEPPPSSRNVAKSFALTSTVTEQKDEVELALPSTQTDPFAKREGKTLTWTNVNMTLTGKRGKDEPDRQLLNNVWGEVPMTKTTAIMGPSGAGYVRGDGIPTTTAAMNRITPCID